MFNKTADTEQSAVLGEKQRIAHIFALLGKDKATELEILRAAKATGIVVGNLREHCTVAADGSMVLKK